MASIIDYNTTMGAAFHHITNTVTGSEIITIFLLVIIFIAAAIGLGLSVELIIIFAVPLLFAAAMMYSGLTSILLYIVLFWIGMIFTRKFILNS